MSPIEGSYFGSTGFPVLLSHATSRPEGQSQVSFMKTSANRRLVSFTRFHTCPCGSQKRPNAHKVSASVNDIDGPRITLACFRYGPRLTVSVPSNPTLACDPSQNSEQVYPRRLVEYSPHHTTDVVTTLGARVR